MRILIFHGYLLRGTGSNVYNANLGRALAKLGHEVHLICQDRKAGELEWPGPGSVTVHVPDIGELLPVFVADRYEGFDVKTFPELSEVELNRYLRANTDAVRAVVERAGPPDAALANHLIMGPVILARANLRFALKVHGSDLSYTLRPHPDRFVSYAREGAEAATGILVGSSHTAEDMLATLGIPELAARTRLGPPGVDTERFRTRPRREADRSVVALADRLEAEAAGGEDSFAREGPVAAAALREWTRGGERVLFVGKLLVNKGVDLLAAAWPLIHRRRRDAGGDPRLLLVGFGAFREGLVELLEALGGGDLERARAAAARGRAHEREDGPSLHILEEFLAAPPDGYAEAAREAGGSVSLAGRLEHDEVAEVMPAADAFVMPSTFPEAFGMVAAEAAACGVPPVSAGHSGMREVSRKLAAAVGPELAPLLSFEVAPGAVQAIAERLGGWLALNAADAARAGGALAQRVEGLWSWERVAAGVIAASRGELDSLPGVELPT